MPYFSSELNYQGLVFVLGWLCWPSQPFVPAPVWTKFIFSPLSEDAIARESHYNNGKLHEHNCAASSYSFSAVLATASSVHLQLVQVMHTFWCSEKILNSNCVTVLKAYTARSISQFCKINILDHFKTKTIKKSFQQSLITHSVLLELFYFAKPRKKYSFFKCINRFLIQYVPQCMQLLMLTDCYCSGSYCSPQKCCC